MVVAWPGTGRSGDIWRGFGNCASIDTLDDLYASLSAHAAGLSLTQLQALYPQMARRTLQRRIEALLDTGRIEARGMGRARRYVALPVTPTGTPAMPRDEWIIHIPLAATSSPTSTDHCWRASRPATSVTFWTATNPIAASAIQGGMRMTSWKAKFDGHLKAPGSPSERKSPKCVASDGLGSCDK